VNVLDLFSGIGGLARGLEAAGMHTVAFCERDEYCRRVLASHWPSVPIYDDVRTLSARRLAADGVERPRVVSGGFPCQDVSYAGFGAGLAGERSGLWSEQHRLIDELRPDFALVENVAALLDRGIEQVCGDLAAIGYDSEWSLVSACTVGAPHVRQRLFIVAYPDSIYGEAWLRRGDFPRGTRTLQALDDPAGPRARYKARLEDPSALYGGADGVAFRRERNHAIGNAVNQDVAELIGRAIMRIAA
jgi:DNA (cytosine-5)-methyltransferase 1